MGTINLKLDYSQIENEFVDPLDLGEHPEEYLILSIKKKRICFLCHKDWCIEKRFDVILFKCGCGTTYLYKNNMVRFRPSFSLRRIEKLRHEWEGAFDGGRSKIPARAND